MAKTTAKDQLDTVKKNAASVRSSIEEIKRIAESSPEDIKKKADEIEKLVTPIQEAANTLIPKDEKWEPVRGFIRRILSREALIAIATIVVIATGTAGDGQEAIGVAVAGAGLILGRSAVKLRQKENKN